MAIIFNPKPITSHGNKLTPQRSFLIVIILTALLMVISGYLIYIYYLAPHPELYQMLPADYDISFELKTDRFSLSHLQKKQLLENETINAVYREALKEIENSIKDLPAEIKNSFIRLPHFVLFFTSPRTFGLISEISDNRAKKTLTQFNFNNISGKLIKGGIFIASNNPTLLEEMANNKLTATAIPYFSIALSPWLKINIQKNFFNQQYSSPVINNFQRIIQPLSLSNNNYSLSLINSYKLLELVLSPERQNFAENNSIIIDNTLLNYLPTDYSMAIGLADIKLLTENLAKNGNLSDFFKHYDSYFWTNYQISLSNIIKKINGPLVIGLNNQHWRVITGASNKEQVEYFLKQYFGQFKPIAKNVVLPDKTLATEMVNNPGSVVFDEKTIENGKLYTIKDQLDGAGYIIINNLLIIGDNLSAVNQSEVDLPCSAGNMQILFSVNPQKSSIISSEMIKQFPNITVYQDSDNNIHACLMLK